VIKESIPRRTFMRRMSLSVAGTAIATGIGFPTADVVNIIIGYRRPFSLLALTSRHSGLSPLSRVLSFKKWLTSRLFGGILKIRQE
jgi:predicted MFS family arabinose efflux permease